MVAGADVVHVRGVWEDVQYRAATAARRAGVPYVVRPCGMLDPTSLRHHRWRKVAYMAWRLRRVLDRAAAIHYTTEGERAACAALRIAAPAIVEPLGLELGEFAQAATAGGAAAAAGFRRDWPRLGDRPYVIFLGRLCAEKGLDVLIPAFARSRRGRAMLVIAGPYYRGYRAGVERAVHGCGVADDVLFTGMLDAGQRSAALAGAELFVMPSRHENFGLAAAEAMAARLPVMVSDHVCLADDVRRAGAGAVVGLDVDAWAAELSRWLADPALRAGAADGGAHLARERYDADRVARAWLDHYGRAVRGAGGAVGRDGPAACRDSVGPSSRGV
jgi:glycosyltransferase involved in cell wall biosynthesis